ncbi:hypothetical protein COU54_04350 [Candidatus Pacearchaeota archaeon CG10_big_fil_rev_8_21_14_0_10_31_24]|nr:MAG: hypothetical protein COU54_04350 [Candidatus Pacearchaeota archaeon CG10_big_fil_rev_8_21_14_0_10_31_24]
METLLTDEEADWQRAERQELALRDYYEGTYTLPLEMMTRGVEEVPIRIINSSEYVARRKHTHRGRRRN